MIARDEARCIGASLQSMVGVVDRLIVLDTGSRDTTPQIAQQLGAQVHHFAWCHDFSAARNAALALSDCDWNIVVDADEVLSEGADALRKLREMPPNFMGCVEVCSAYRMGNSEGLMQASSRLPRVLPAAVRYEGLIHEQPVSTLPRLALPVRFAHDGYLPEQMAQKGARNRHLLEEAVRQAPLDAYLHYQLGKDHEVHDRFLEARPHYEQAMQLLGDQAGREPAWRHDLVLRHLFTLKATGQVQAAVVCAEQEMPNWQDSPDFFFVLGDVLLEMAVTQPETGPSLLPMIEECWQRCLSIGENPRLDGAVAGRGSHLARQQLDLLASVLA